TIVLRRRGNNEAALSQVRTDRGKATMDRIRALVADMENEERTLLAARQTEWRDAIDLSSRITWSGSVVLLFLIVGAGVTASRDHGARETEIWMRSGQARLSERLQGEQRLDVLGSNALGFLAGFLEAQVGAFYVREMDGRFRRFAGYALPPSMEADVIRMG